MLEIIGILFVGYIVISFLYGVCKGLSIRSTRRAARNYLANRS